MKFDIDDNIMHRACEQAVSRYIGSFEFDRELKPLIAAAVRDALAAENIPAQVAAAVRARVAQSVATTVQRRLDRRVADVTREQVELPEVTR